MKPIFVLLAVATVLLGGCIVAPYDEPHRGGYDHGGYDRDRGEHDRDRDRGERGDRGRYQGGQGWERGGY